MTDASISGPLGLVSVLAASAVLAGVALWQGRRRSRAMAAAAESLGLSFEGDTKAGAPSGIAALRALADVPLLSRGFNQSARNAMAGRRAGRDVRVFDLRYHHRKRGGSYAEVTVGLVPGGGAGLPDFALAPENVVQKLGEALGGADIDFLTHPQFSERYRLLGTDEAAIRHAFTPEVLALFQGETGWTVEVSGGHLVASLGAGCLNPKKVPDLVDGALRIVELLARR